VPVHQSRESERHDSTDAGYRHQQPRPRIAAGRVACTLLLEAVKLAPQLPPTGPAQARMPSNEFAGGDRPTGEAFDKRKYLLLPRARRILRRGGGRRDWPGSIGRRYAHVESSWRLTHLVVPDHIKVAVVKSCLFDPQINRIRRYGITMAQQFCPNPLPTHLASRLNGVRLRGS
jgi:hypothetical protein